MKEINIEQPHGTLIDSDDYVVKRFGNWEVGTHKVPESVESVEYVDGPAAHTRARNWRYTIAPPPVDLSTDKTQLPNDGTNKATISMTLNPDADSPRDTTLTIDGKSFYETLEPGASTEEEVTTTKQSGTTIAVAVDGENIQRTTVELEVVEA